jgi:hypothetical protein
MRPPSTTTVSPVTKFERSEARKSATPAISSGSPRRSSALLLLVDFVNSGSFHSASESLVRITPGAIALTRMPYSSPPYIALCLCSKNCFGARSHVLAHTVYRLTVVCRCAGARGITCPGHIWQRFLRRSGPNRLQTRSRCHLFCSCRYLPPSRRYRLLPHKGRVWAHPAG